FPALLALGPCSSSTPGVSVSGNNTNVTVNGPTIINGDSTCFSNPSGTFAPTPPPTFVPNGFLDPFSTLQAPGDCSGQAGVKTGSVYGPGVYTSLVDINSAVTFQPTATNSVFIFCGG